MTKSVINTSDFSGEQFLYNLIADDPSLLDYMSKAQNGNEYDFKATNGIPDGSIPLDPYRGMPLGYTESGAPIYTSARDIGNIAAGYIAASKGLPWALARIGFDSYQSRQSGNIQKEGISTRNAERYGYEMVKRGIPGISRIPSLWIR